MFTLARRYVKTSFVFFLLGLLLGGYLAVSKELLGTGVRPQLPAAHGHILLVGFVIMLIMGIALWMFPRPAKDDTRYSPDVAAFTYWILTIATLLRFFGEIASAYAYFPILPWVIAVGGLGQVAAGVLFVYNIWTRVRPVGSQFREAAGEKF